MGILNNIRVVELGQAFAGPSAAEVLANLGAEVIKVERPGDGDQTRSWGPPFWGEDAAAFHAVNRNKLSVECDLTTAEGIEQLLAVIEKADVLLHNTRPGTLEKLGLGYDVLSRRFPRLIFAEISAFGHTGPMREFPGYEILSQAFGGVMSITGEKDGMPVRCGPSICDFGAGLWLVVGLLSALLRRDQTGRGGLVQTSLFETGLFWSAISASGYLASGEEPVRMGAGHYLLAPYGYFETGTDPIVLACANDGLFVKLAKALGRPELARDERFIDNPSRVKNKALIEQIVGDIFLTESREYWIRLLNDAGVPASPMNTIPQALDHEQTAALGMVVCHPDRPEIRSVGFPLSIDGQRPSVRHSAPGLGAHTAQVFGTET